jgi:hypothetical protein
VRVRRLLAVLVLVAGGALGGSALGGSALARALGGSALARASATPGPVSPALISFLNSAGTLFRVVSRGHSRISEQAAIRHALREAPWRPVTATGISLIRLVREGINAPAGSLAWLVSVAPVDQVGGGPAPGGPAPGGPAPGGPAPGGPAPGGPVGAQMPPAANFYVVAVAATNGHFIAAAHGYTGTAPAQ